MQRPIRYFVVNEKTDIMHAFGLCRQTKKRNVPIRLFDTPEELREYSGRPLRMCNSCRKELSKLK